MRYAFFGGSFSPPHGGHLHIARAARQRLHLDEVWLAPVGRQPLKAEDSTPFADRLAMTRLLVAGEPGLSVSAVDAPRARPNYTAETLPLLRAEASPLLTGAELFLLAGADSFLSLPQWFAPERLLQPAAEGGLLDGWILAARPGFPLDALPGALPAGYTLTPSATPAPGTLAYTVHTPAGTPATPIHVLPDLDDPASATAVREALRHGHTPAELRPSVAQYIREHRLYAC